MNTRITLENWFQKLWNVKIFSKNKPKTPPGGKSGGKPDGKPGGIPGGKSAGRVHVPTMFQMEMAECGAASLGMVLGYFKRFVSMEELRQKLGVSRDGSNARSIKRAGEEYGLKVTAQRLKTEEALKGPFPIIIFWNFYHFLVVEGAKGNKVWLSDPAAGKRCISYQEFDEGSTGVTLRFEPGPGFEQAGYRPGDFERIWTWIGGLRKFLFVFVALQLLVTLPVVALPGMSKLFIDDYLLNNNIDVLHPVLIWIGLSLIIIWGLLYVQNQVVQRFELKLSLTRTASVFYHILQLPQQFFQQSQKGDISNRVEVHERASALLSRDVLPGVAHLLTIPIFFAAMLMYSWALTLVNVFSILLILTASSVLRERIANQFIRLEQEKAMRYSMSVSGLQIFETLKASGSEDDFFARFAGFQARVTNAEQPLLWLSQTLSAIPTFLISVSSVLTLGLGAVLIINDQLTVGALIAFQLLVVGLNVPVKKVSDLFSKFQDLVSTLARLDGVISYPRDPLLTKPEGTAVQVVPGGRLSGLLEFDGITFGYGLNAPALVENFNLRLEPGKRVAIVGRSGSGKSTLAKLATGLFQPWQGTIRLDGLDIKELSRDLVSNSMSSTDQEVFLFSGTIRENLTMWDDSVSLETVTNAAIKANIHEVISQRPNGYDHRVSGGGKNFSSGEKQRLEIARALISQPSLLVLDEATSCLDANTEAEILDQIRKLGCSCMIISHRLSTVRDCDEIILLEEGKVVERGNHDDLMALQGGYFRLVSTE